VRNRAAHVYSDLSLLRNAHLVNPVTGSTPAGIRGAASAGGLMTGLLPGDVAGTGSGSVPADDEADSPPARVSRHPRTDAQGYRLRVLVSMPGDTEAFLRESHRRSAPVREAQAAWASPVASRRHPEEGHDDDRPCGGLGRVGIDVDQDAQGAAADVGSRQGEHSGDEPRSAHVDGRVWAALPAASARVVPLT
jgi:hypothetical protein